ncbi:competence protein ComK [Metabacillus fastidiosus]|uniref:competence protein ComK n=1 Tax=Metabacillus fastidiosus TaxID=1458 RepID=UPI002E23F7EF|nr:competence protein ComK [Metabacillus fastidiosus]MED4455648.1 competence protein ComK [Metabacillus fastidiosus]
MNSVKVRIIENSNLFNNISDSAVLKRVLQTKEMLDNMYEQLLKSLKVEREEEDYIIKGNTMMIIPFYAEQGALNSIVIDRFEAVKVKRKSQNIIDESCIYFASDMKGRIRSAAKILKGHQMLPIVISKMNKTCMIPISSPYNKRCIWVSYRHIIDITSYKRKSILTLENGQRFELNVSRKAMENKINRANRLVNTYDIRNKEMQDTYKANCIAETKVIYVPDLE